MNASRQFYSVYLSNKAVELRSGGDTNFGEGRLICRQIHYQNILDFAMNLAKYKALPFQNFVKPQH
ncbi:MAG TPA: hypothetical protein V6C65_19830 [Allocoleopsis sp.]